MPISSLHRPIEFSFPQAVGLLSILHFSTASVWLFETVFAQLYSFHPVIEFFPYRS